ncbi:43kDa postsynaptic protein [Trema orientale]|uniref:RING-type E3 ubiquitin transferase n=1 Tax=Trema orientale TaxID=63057 RepID=A0A2P5EHT9_TREOI|nr:43kDa postsynaptic protein [Trema orientale]
MARPEPLYDYRIRFLDPECDNSNARSSTTEHKQRLVAQCQSLVIYLKLNHLLRLTSGDPEIDQSGVNDIPVEAIREHFGVPCHSFSSLPTDVMTEEITNRIGVPFDFAEFLSWELSNFASKIPSEEYARCKTIHVILDVVVVTRFDGDEETDRALRESAELIQTVPASQSSIQALKKVRVESLLGDHHGDQYCTICLEKMSFDQDGDDQKLVEMPCSHVYHKDCIEQWLKTSHMCPLCRYAMPTSY